MKYVIIIAMFSMFIVGCSPDFKAGDCTSFSGYKERWEHNDNEEKIIEVGKEQYLIESIGPLSHEKIQYSMSFRIHDISSHKIKCPKELE